MNRIPTVPGMRKFSQNSLLILAFAFLLVAANQENDSTIGVRENVSLFREESVKFAARTSVLKESVAAIDGDKPESILAAIAALKEARLGYKRIEFFMEYFFFNSARIYNRAAKNEIEEPYLEYQKPIGLQYMETLLAAEDPAANKDELVQQATILNHSALDLTSLLYEFKATDNQLLESHRLALIRVIAMGITGFDAPVLKTGIQESYAVLEVMGKGLQPYLKTGKVPVDSTQKYLKSSLHYLQQHPDFDTFDRLEFLTDHALPLQKYLGKLIRDLGLELNTAGKLNYTADHLFSANTLNEVAFGTKQPTVAADEIVLGKKLFSDPSLSGNEAVSCASCHLPDNYFQDGVAKSAGFVPGQQVKRNAPSLFYTAYQHAQFWDGRARTLVEQIEDVLRSPLEMNGNPEAIRTTVNKSGSYGRMFKKVYGKKEITEAQVYKAIASFVSTLHPFNSNFDRYINGDQQAMTASQKNGFNLFMGKAQCGTCHFAPVFNGLIPPLYALTEFEVLGTTLTEDLAHPKPDPDSGRIGFRPIDFYRGAFKTPTVRNSAVTGPYMHNGAFRSLDSLVEFYNRGGGAGLGLDLPFQTMSADPLNLSEKEKKEVIDFLNALTDRTVKSL